MSNPKSSALSAYRAKTAEAERRLAKVFVAYVRTHVDRKPRGFVVYSTDGELALWRNDYFQIFYTTPESLQNGEVTTVIDEIRQSLRKLYSEKVMHSTVLTKVLGPYIRLVLESWHEPLALAVCAVLVDCVQKFETLDYRGYTERLPTDKGPTLTRIIGAYDREVRKLVRSAITTYLIDRSPTKANQRRLVKLVRRITKHRTVGCVPIVQ